MQAQAAVAKVAGRCGQLVEQSELAVEPADDAGGDRKAAQEEDLDRDECQSRPREGVRPKSKTNVRGDNGARRQSGDGEGSRQSMVLQ